MSILAAAAVFGWWPAASARQARRDADAPVFVDVSRQTGLDFEHWSGGAGALLLPEVIGAGGALLDYDNDGDLDLFAVQGAALGAGGSVAPAMIGTRPGSRLYRNDVDRDGRVRFVDVTEASGIVARGYGIGAATGDYDNDGWMDLYVTSLGSNHLFRNERDGSFRDVTDLAGADDARWSTSATFVDYDRDGWLDLFVANYVDFAIEMPRACFAAGSARDYCNPAVYDPVPDRLLHNEGDGTFRDVSARSGIGAASERGLGVLAADVDGDGWTDLYVANDGDPNQLWMNQGGDGTFRDDALLAGVAVNRAGRPQGGMGVDLADVDGDGDEDLFVTNLDNESNTLYEALGRGLFEDRTVEFGLFRLGLTGFGARFLDVDNDGWLDLLAVNGAVRRLAAQVRAGDPHPLRQPRRLFRNDGAGRFVDVSGEAGPAFVSPEIGRGLAAGDLDNDGDIDAVVFNNSGPLRVLLNEIGARRHWLGVRVVDPRSGRDLLAARVELRRPERSALVRRVQVDGSYASAGDPRVLFGLGDDGGAQTVVVRVGASEERFSDLAVDRYWVLEPGRPPRPADASR